MRRTAWTMAIAASVALAGAAWGQVRQVYNGNALDANPQVGGGQSNQPVQGYTPVTGNDIFYGNVAGLKYFHGNVPYSNPYEFNGPLGSSGLNNFARQSSGPPPTQQNLGQTMMFYLPSRQVSTLGGNYGPQPTNGGLDNRVAPGPTVSMLSSVSGVSAYSYGQSVPINAAAAMRRYDSLGQDITDVGPLTPSGLYGFRAALAMPQQVDPRETERLALEKEKRRGDLGKTEQIGVTTRPLGNIEGEIAASVRVNPEIESDVYNALRGKLDAKLATVNGTPATLPGSEGAASLLGSPAATTLPTQSTDPTKLFYVPPTYKNKPLSEEKTEVLQSGKDITPLETLSGPKRSVFNEFMATAEKELQEGRYVDAAQTYAQAGEFSPDNPLPLIGRVHAELGAGMYAAASVDLQVLFEKKPELIALRYDLKKFIPEQRLEYMVRDVSRLSRMKRNAPANFLVAYLDYQLDRKDDLKLQLDYWQKQEKDNPWPANLRRAWVEQSPEKK